MTTLAVSKFATPEGANQMLDTITSLQKMELIKVQDAAIVTWPAGKDKPKSKQPVSMAGMGALQGALRGILSGMIFIVPIHGLEVGQFIAPWAAR